MVAHLHLSMRPGPSQPPPPPFFWPVLALPATETAVNVTGGQTGTVSAVSTPSTPVRDDNVSEHATLSQLAEQIETLTASLHEARFWARHYAAGAVVRDLELPDWLFDTEELDQ